MKKITNEDVVIMDEDALTELLEENSEDNSEKIDESVADEDNESEKADSETGNDEESNETADTETDSDEESDEAADTETDSDEESDEAADIEADSDEELDEAADTETDSDKEPEIAESEADNNQQSDEESNKSEKETSSDDINLEDDSDFEFIEPFESTLKKEDLKPVEISLPQRKKIEISPEFKKKFWKITGIVCASIAAVYVVGILYFSTHYYANTIIAGKDYSFKSYKKVSSDLDNRNMEFDINLIGREDTGLVVKSADVIEKTTYDKTGLFTFNIMRGLGWIEKCLNGMNMDLPASVSVNDAKLTEIIAGSSLCDKSLTKKAEDAYVKDCVATTGQFEVVEGYQGTELEADKAAAVVSEVLNNVVSNNTVVDVKLYEADCYKHSVVSTDNAKLNAIKDKANSMLKTKVTIDWNGVEEILDASDIRYMIDITDNDAVLNELDVKAYVLRQDDKYLTYGKTLAFTTHDRRRKNIKRRDYGWQVDTELLTQELIEDIKSGAVKTKELEYTHEAYVKGQNDIGDSFVEVDLGQQHLYLHIDGNIVLDTDFVSGNEALKHHTPEGIDAITYKAKSVVLRGPGYASPVKYWMPFNGGIGLHDATWRSSFGGNIYKTSGSHGCVNLPLDMAGEIYELVEKDFPVVCYW